MVGGVGWGEVGGGMIHKEETELQKMEDYVTKNPPIHHPHWKLNVIKL